MIYGQKKGLCFSMMDICFSGCRKIRKKKGKSSAIFCLDKVGQKRYHRPQVHKTCDEKEEYLRRIFRELSGGAR